MTDSHNLSRGFVDEARLLDEAEVVRVVRDKGSSSQEAQLLMTRLYRYAIPVMRDLVKSGRIVNKVMQVGRPVNFGELERLSDADQMDLVLDVIAEAGRLFMSQFLLGEQRWRPGLASIGTTFINACIRVFPSELRKVSRAAQLKASNEVLVDAMPDDVQQLTAATSSEGVDPERQVLAKLELMEVLARVTERERHILLLHGAGLTHGEIASTIDATPDAVRKMLARAREKIRKDRARRSIELTNDEFTKTLIETWQHLQKWGVRTLETAVTVKGIIDNERKTFEDSRFPALYRPSPKIPHNMLDIILDHIDVDVDREDRVSWMSKRARVTRRVLDAIRTEFPDVNRPNPHSKGAVSDLQQFYDSLKLACAPEETSSFS